MALDANEKPGRSVSKFESMLKTDDVYFFDAEDFEEIVHHYLNHGKMALAKKAIKIGLKQHPGSVELQLLEVEVLVFENQLDLAEELLDQLQLLDANNEEIYIQRANINSKKDNHIGAVMLLQKALELTDNSFDIYSLLGMEYLFMDDFDSAKKSFMKCVDFDQQDFSSLYNVIYCFEFLEDYEGAIHYLNDYLDRNPYCEVAWHQLGKQYVNKKMFPEALTAFDFAIISDDTFIGAYFEKGKVLENMGKYGEAIENYETTIRIEDPTSHAYLRIGKCHEKLGDHEMAKYYYYQTVHEDPLLDKGWLAITDFYNRMGNHKKALYYINKALNIDGQNPHYWKKCARIHSALENYAQADFAYKQTVELDLCELELWLEWATVMLRIDDIAAGIQILEQGMGFYPESPEIHYRLAGYLLMAGDLVNARNTLRKAVKEHYGKLHLFEEEFGQFHYLDWVQEIIVKRKRASR